MQELIKVNYENERPTVSGRELHGFLEVKERYNDWFKRMAEYGFDESVDFMSFTENTVKPTGGRPATDHQLTVDMAKEISMIQRNEKGKQARQYFIQLEKHWNSPEMVMKRALDFANQAVKKLQLENSQLAVDKAIMQPKADYFDELVDRNLLTNFRDTAKQLQIQEKKFVSYLVEKKYIYRDNSGKIMPRAKKNDGLFEIKETFNNKTGWKGVQTLITPKGRETFRLLCKDL